MKFQDDISNMNTYTHTHTHTDKPKPICPPLFQSWGHKKGAGQLCGYCAADLCLCFAYVKSQFSHDAAHINF